MAYYPGDLLFIYSVLSFEYLFGQIGMGGFKNTRFGVNAVSAGGERC
jgi:hypothetical protein